MVKTELPQCKFRKLQFGFSQESIPDISGMGLEKDTSVHLKQN